MSTARAKAERDQATVTQDAPIQLPSVLLPGGLGAGNPRRPRRQRPDPADSPANPPTQVPTADASGDQSAAQQGGTGDQTSTTQTDPKQGLFDYLLGN